MEDPETMPNSLPDAGVEAAGLSEAERQRRAEEVMEQMLLAQEAEDGGSSAGGDENDDHDHDDDDDDDAPGNNNGHAGNNGGAFFDEGLMAAAQMQFDGEDDGAPRAAVAGRNNTIHHHGRKRNPFSYVQLSLFAAGALIYYAFRSRQQWYLALVYLTSSKWAYVVLGNALVASLIWIFQLFTGFFLNGLRLAEAEGLGDFFRWNITETCLALTIFRAELTVKTGILFLVFVLAKCLHWVADTREGHLRMTEEVVMVQPSSRWPSLRWTHVKLLLCMYLLQLMDVLAVLQCGHDIWENGPNVSILFAFEGAIMLTSVVSNILLWHLHLLDGLIHYAHETTEPSSPMHRWIHPWKEHKATMIFAVEVQAQAAKFFFYVTFFAIVMTYYGLPINLIREVYISFQALKQRLTAFGKYRLLMASMNRFSNPTAEELEEESTCIICRDEMNVETAKRLPGCGHIFHKSCLREWLVQQQTCPTCRSDISAMEARQRQQVVLNARIQEQEQQEADSAVPPVDGTHEGSVDALRSPDEGSTLHDREAAADGSTATASATLADLGEDRDMSAPFSAASNRGKRVRIVDAETSSVEAAAAAPSSFHDSFVYHDRPAFPAFYRVIKDAGAPVYNNGEAVSFVIRCIPFGVVVLGRELSWRNCDGENCLMVRMPDGWVNDDDIERIVAVPFEPLQ